MDNRIQNMPIKRYMTWVRPYGPPNHRFDQPWLR